MEKPYLVLGIYKPEVWSAKKVGKELTKLTKEHGLIPHVDPAHGPLQESKKCPWVSLPLHAEVRRRTFNTAQAEGWHYDGDTTPGSKPNCCLVLWASNNPTEIMYKGKVYQANPYEVIIFKNMSVTHRRPAGVPKVRWVFRQRVSVPSHIQLL